VSGLRSFSLLPAQQHRLRVIPVGMRPRPTRMCGMRCWRFCCPVVNGPTMRVDRVRVITDVYATTVVRVQVLAKAQMRTRVLEGHGSISSSNRSKHVQRCWCCCPLVRRSWLTMRVDGSLAYHLVTNTRARHNLSSAVHLGMRPRPFRTCRTRYWCCCPLVSWLTTLTARPT
jgi:hypothetical protein